MPLHSHRSYICIGNYQLLIREEPYKKCGFAILGESWPPSLISVMQIRNSKTSEYEEELLTENKAIYQNHFTGARTVYDVEYMN